MKCLKKFGLCSASFFAMMMMSSFVTLEASPENCKHKDKTRSFLKTNAIQEGINAINTFTLNFSAAIRQTNPTLQAAEVQAIVDSLANPFSITIIDPTIPLTVTATDYNSLLTIVQSYSSTLSFDVALVGNHSLTNYEMNCRGHRTLNIQALDYIIQTANVGGASTLVSALDNYVITEVDCGSFKIQSLVETVIGKTEMCCPIIP